MKRLNSNEQPCCPAADRGSVLILALWTIFLLALLATAVGAYVDARLSVARTVERRLIGYQAARTGVERALAVLVTETNAWDALTGRWADSLADFSNVVCGAGAFSIVSFVETETGAPKTKCGLYDEQSKIDLNLARPEVLAALLEEAAGVGAEAAVRLADAMNKARTRPVTGAPGVGMETGWMDPGIERGPLQSVEELQWVKGMTPAVFEKVRRHVTVHGGARVNLNTAGSVVLKALTRRTGGGTGGGGPGLVRKMLQFRSRGGIFKSYVGSGLAEAFGTEVKMSDEERRCLYGLAPFVSVASDHFGGVVEGYPLGRPGESRRIEFVWCRSRHKIEQWHED